ncbi:hypothetical protein PR048_027358 [Dryococelus australis]|uniref:Uncharacterized protein n=1 Tax=Dryococelus australis TaxID=614101 RepID=A0ABQ9GF90_9NEOP|nr:hypothetical protein PR048_027358 [Dryococelus australis]
MHLKACGVDSMGKVRGGGIFHGRLYARRRGRSGCLTDTIFPLSGAAAQSILLQPVFIPRAWLPVPFQRPLENPSPRRTREKGTERERENSPRGLFPPGWRVGFVALRPSCAACLLGRGVPTCPKKGLAYAKKPPLPPSLNNVLQKRRGAVARPDEESLTPDLQICPRRRRLRADRHAPAVAFSTAASSPGHKGDRARTYPMVRLLNPHPGGAGSIPGGAAPGLAQVGIVLNDSGGRRVFSGVSRFPRPCILAPPHSHLASTLSAFKTSMCWTWLQHAREGRTWSIHVARRAYVQGIARRRQKTTRRRLQTSCGGCVALVKPGGSVLFVVNMPTARSLTQEYGHREKHGRGHLPVPSSPTRECPRLLLRGVEGTRKPRCKYTSIYLSSDTAGVRSGGLESEREREREGRQRGVQGDTMRCKEGRCCAYKHTGTIIAASSSMRRRRSATSVPLPMQIHSQHPPPTHSAIARKTLPQCCRAGLTNILVRPLQLSAPPERGRRRGCDASYVTVISHFPDCPGTGTEGEGVRRGSERVCLGGAEDRGGSPTRSRTAHNGSSRPVRATARSNIYSAREMNHALSTQGGQDSCDSWPDPRPKPGTSSHPHLLYHRGSEILVLRNQACGLAKVLSTPLMPIPGHNSSRLPLTARPVSESGNLSRPPPAYGVNHYQHESNHSDRTPERTSWWGQPIVSCYHLLSMVHRVFGYSPKHVRFGGSALVFGGVTWVLLTPYPHVVPVLLAVSRMLEEAVGDFMFQQDGAPPHWHLAVRGYLNEMLPQRWTGHEAAGDQALHHCPPPPRPKEAWILHRASFFYGEIPDSRDRLQSSINSVHGPLPREEVLSLRVCLSHAVTLLLAEPARQSRLIFYRLHKNCSNFTLPKNFLETLQKVKVRFPVTSIMLRALNKPGDDGAMVSRATRTDPGSSPAFIYQVRGRSGGASVTALCSRCGIARRGTMQKTRREAADVVSRAASRSNTDTMWNRYVNILATKEPPHHLSSTSRRKDSPLLALLPPGDHVQEFLVLRAHGFVVLAVVGDVDSRARPRARPRALRSEGRRRRGGGVGAGRRRLAAAVAVLRGRRRPRLLGRVLLEQALQPSDVLHRHAQRLHLAELLGGGAGGRGGGGGRRRAQRRRHRHGDVLAERREAVVHLLDAVALAGVAPGHRRRLVVVVGRRRVAKADAPLAAQGVRGRRDALRGRRLDVARLLLGCERDQADCGRRHGSRRRRRQQLGRGCHAVRCCLAGGWSPSGGTPVAWGSRGSPDLEIRPTSSTRDGSRLPNCGKADPMRRRVTGPRGGGGTTGIAPPGSLKGEGHTLPISQPLPTDAKAGTPASVCFREEGRTVRRVACPRDSCTFRCACTGAASTRSSVFLAVLKQAPACPARRLQSDTHAVAHNRFIEQSIICSPLAKWSRREMCAPAPSTPHSLSGPGTSCWLSLHPHAGMKGRGKREIPEENPPTSGIVRHDSPMRKSGSDPAGD